MGRWAAINGITTGAKQVDIKADKGGGDFVQAPLATPPNEDSVPLPQDTAAVMELPGQGTYATVGTVDKDPQFLAQPGEKRVYARSGVGTEVCEVWLKNDGTASVSNDSVSSEWRPDGSVLTTNGAGFWELQSDGTINLNGVTIDPAGNIVSPTTILAKKVTGTDDVISAGISGSTHTHPQANDSAGNTEQDTGAPI